MTYANNAATLFAVLIYVAGSLGPAGQMNGKVACTALFIAMVSQIGFAVIAKVTGKWS